jgi:phospholipid/cholesterol/gamma-HCH transport system permease protein
MNTLSLMGMRVVGAWRRQIYLAAVAWGLFRVGLRTGSWPRTTRNVLARQILFTGLEASRFVSLIALLVGISIVVQTQVWLLRVGQSALLGPILVAVVIRELGPLLTNFVVIGRSGAAISTELASMRVTGEVQVLDAQGLDPFTYLVLPRAVGVAVSVFCLTIVFYVVSFVSGFLSGSLLGVHTGSPRAFIDSVLGALKPADVFNLLAKTIIPGLLTGAICCTEGLSVRGAITEVPQAATRGLVRSVATLFITSAIVSLLMYL